MALRVLRCPNGLRHVSLDASHGEKIIFSEFSGLGMQIRGEQNIVSTKKRNKRNKGEKRESKSGKRKDKKKKMEKMI